MLGAHTVNQDGGLLYTAYPIKDSNLLMDEDAAVEKPCQLNFHITLQAKRYSQVFTLESRRPTMSRDGGYSTVVVDSKRRNWKKLMV